MALYNRPVDLDSQSDDDESLDIEDQSDGEEDDVEDPVVVVSLLDEKQFPDAMTMLAYCKAEHGFDFLALRERLSLDFHGTVRLINFVREHVRNGEALPKDIEAGDIQDERLLKPVLADDALIMSIDELPDTTADQSEPMPASSRDIQSSLHGEGHSSTHVAEDGLRRRNAELELQVEKLTNQFAAYRLAVEQTLDRRWGDDADVAEVVEPPAQRAKSGPGTVASAGGSEDYWASYAHHDIHETMLKDAVRTDAYRDFIYDNKHLFAGKVVLDIGCGTGILSMFCAKAGARQVIAVDASDIIDKAREIVFSNGLADTICCLRGCIEEVKLPVDNVDIIVSEWMGYCLLYEAMLPSVLWARDRYLKPGGLLVPSHASLWIAPVAEAEFVSEHVHFWRDVYGFDMAAMQTRLCDDVWVQTLPATSLAGVSHCFRLLDLGMVKASDLTFSVPWTSTFSPSMDLQRLNGFLVWFDIFFATTPAEDRTVTDTVSAQQWIAKREGRVAFTTGPQGPETHWRQGLFLLPPVSTPKDGATEHGMLRGDIEYSAPDNHARGLTVRVSWQGDVPAADNKHSRSWKLH